MKSSFIQAAVFGLLSLTQANFLESRNTCKNDNCLNEVRCQDPHQALIAKTDCSKFLQSTVTSTITPATVTKTVVVSVAGKSTQTATATSVILSTITVSTETDIVTAVSTTTASEIIDIPITSILTILERRNYNSIPAYASCCSNSAMYSSACSCAGVTIYITSTTVTAPTPTKTSTSTSTIISTIKIVKTISTTATISKTRTTSTTTSTITTATTYLVGVPTLVILTTTSTTIPAPSASASIRPVCGVYINYLADEYTQYFSGYGVTENPVNPGDDSARPAFTVQIAGTMAACAAFDACAEDAVRPGYVRYFSFDLHYRFSTGMWECVIYGHHNTDPSYFNVVDPDVGETYGGTGIDLYGGYDG